jgi:hypothetical protein
MCNNNNNNYDAFLTLSNLHLLYLASPSLCSQLRRRRNKLIFSMQLAIQQYPFPQRFQLASAPLPALPCPSLALLLVRFTH